MVLAKGIGNKTDSIVRDRVWGLPLQMNDEEGQSVSVGLWKIADVLIYQGNAVVIIRQLYENRVNGYYSVY